MLSEGGGGEWPHLVRELVDDDTKQWDREKITYWFEPHICNDIWRIPLDNMQTQDVLIWKENKSRTFSIKSAYKVALRLQYPLAGDHSMEHTNRQVWKAIWKWIPHRRFGTSSREPAQIYSQPKVTCRCVRWRLTLILGCTDMPFLATCRCSTRVGHWN